MATIGRSSVAPGVFLTIAPGSGAAPVGFGDRPRLARGVGAGNLAIGAALPFGRGRAYWMGARVAGNAGNAGLRGGWPAARHAGAAPSASWPRWAA